MKQESYGVALVVEAGGSQVFARWDEVSSPCVRVMSRRSR